MIKLSIITINYNDAKGLEKTIKSVISQTYKNYEYIVIDGDSKDGSKGVIEKYNDNINVAISEPDSGTYNAMNKGASFAKGEYLLFLNSGDNLYNDSVLHELFETHPTTDVVSSCCIDYTETTRYLRTPPKKVSLYTFVGGSLPHPTSIIKKTIFDRIGGYNEQYKILSDWLFFIDAILINNATYSTTNIIMTEFNCFGISSTKGETEINDCYIELEKRFGKILSDYLKPEDEAIQNVAFWIANLSKTKKNLISFPFKVVNRILKLRNTLSRKIGVTVIK